MSTSEIEKVVSALRGFASRDAELTTRYVNPSKFIQHNPFVADGVEGLKDEISQLPRENHHLEVVRAFQDGPYVFTQTEGLIGGQGVFFDIFRFEDGLMVEHWVFSAPAAPPNESGHTQTDGPTEAKHLQDTEKNKSIMREYYEAIHIAGDHGKIPQYFSGDFCIRHEPGVKDGVAAFAHDVESLMQHRTIDELKFLLGQGDFVFIAAKGTHESKPCAYIDLYRIEGEKIVEHWGFPENIPPQEERKNNNGML
jgi:predicted SnoaL-like aldol condensation-catalyzing enzyme